MAQLITCSIHDTTDETVPFCIREPEDASYVVLKLGPNASVFISPERIRELYLVLGNFLAIHSARERAIEEEQRAEQAIEDRDAQETGGMRCPPRE